MVEAFILSTVSEETTLTLLGVEGLKIPPDAWSEPMYTSSQILKAKEGNIIVRGSLVERPIRNEKTLASMSPVLGVTDDGGISVAGDIIYADREHPLRFTTLARINMLQTNGIFKSTYIFLAPAFFAQISFNNDKKV